MIPYLLAAVGGYFIGQSRKDKQFADGGTVSYADWGKMDSTDKIKYIKENGEVYIGGTYYTVIGNDLVEVNNEDGWYAYLPDFYDVDYEDGEYRAYGYARGTNKEDALENIKEVYIPYVIDRYFDKEMEDLVPIKLPIREYDSMYYVGDFVDVDGDGWVTKEDAKKAIEEHLYENLEVVGPKK